MSAKSVSLSVVIPAYNEATYIDRLLEALARQDFKDFEVIVSDAESKDGTKEVVSSFKDKMDVEFIEAPPRGPAFGRNQGAKLARGDWLLFLDADDDISDPAFIATILEEAEKRGWQTATAKMKPIDATWLEWPGFIINYRYIKLLSHTKRPVAPGYCILTKRDLFESSGGFNEKIQFGEDYDYVSRNAKHGFGFVEKTFYLVDMRRFRQEGFLWVLRTIANEFQRLRSSQRLEENKLKYEFGKHPKRAKNS